MQFAHGEHEWAKEMKKKGKGKMPPKEWIMKKRVSTVLGSILLILVLLYLAFWSEGFTTFQKIAVLLIAMLAWGAIKAIVYIPEMHHYCK